MARCRAAWVVWAAWTCKATPYTFRTNNSLVPKGPGEETPRGFFVGGVLGSMRIDVQQSEQTGLARLASRDSYAPALETSGNASGSRMDSTDRSMSRSGQ